MIRWQARLSRTIDPHQPINWAHPLNYGLAHCWIAAPPFSCFGDRIRDLVFAKKKPSDMIAVDDSSVEEPVVARGPHSYIGALNFPISGIHVGATFTAITGAFAVFAGLNSRDVADGVSPFGAQDGDTWYVPRNGGTALDCRLQTQTEGLHQVALTGACDNKWHRVGVVYNGATWACFLDGVQINSIACTGAIGVTAGDLFNELQQGRAAGNYCDCLISSVTMYTGTFAAGDRLAAIDHEQWVRGFPESLNWITGRSFFGESLAVSTFPWSSPGYSRKARVRAAAY